MFCNKVEYVMGAWSSTNLTTGDQMFWPLESVSVFQNPPLAVEVNSMFQRQRGRAS